MMKSIASRFALLAICTITVSCSNPSIRVIDKEFFRTTKPKRLMIFRFEGNPNFVEESTDYFIATLQGKYHGEIIRADPVREETADIHSGSNIAPLDIAINKAKTKSADLLILGKVSSHKTEETMNGFSTVRIIDVASGKQVANFHRPSGLLFGYSEHQCVMKAVKRTAQDAVRALTP